MRDAAGQPLGVGMRVSVGADVGLVVRVSDPDGDVNSYGRPVAILPRVHVEGDGWRDAFPARWCATGPWDDDTDEYVCDEVIAL